MEERFYSWTAPYASGVDLLHQVTDLLGIAVAGPQGNRFMGFGFPDQTIIWDGTAVENTSTMLLEDQSDPIPWRTVDILNGFSSSLAEALAAHPLISFRTRMPFSRCVPCGRSTDQGGLAIW